MYSVTEKSMVGALGIEPRTIRLKVECSTAELRAQDLPGLRNAALKVRRNIGSSRKAVNS